ncbi:uncharacterized protein [Antedon mediterranea]|uniref:uncharacterized protein isoform X2 n=1 Tax=Antedon mediterranea TaxID=105859 RepID=UPI003AF58F74
MQLKYVLGLCEKKHEQIVPYSPENTHHILTRIENFERESGAVIENIPNDSKLRVTASDEFSLVTACMLIQTAEEPEITLTNSNTSDYADSSSCETNDLNRNTGEISCLVSKKNRDKVVVEKEKLRKSEDDEKDLLLQKYTEMLDFVLKLGYTKHQLDQVLPQLGADADRNDVLGALERSSSIPADVDRTSTITRSADVADFQHVVDDTANLRPIIIDGSNIAMSFGRKEVFECRGIKIVVDWFKKRSHSTIIVFVPEWRKESSKPNTLIEDQHIMLDLEREGILVFTPSRRVNGMRKTCYDDRYIVKTAVDLDGIIVSKDNFRDLQNENLEWKKFIAERLLMYAFVTDKFMPPDDPLGRNGPSLDNFLRIKPLQVDPITHCPYGNKCTFGNKCKYFHSDRPRYKSVADSLKDNHKFRNKTKSPTGGAEKLGADARAMSYTAPLLSRREESPTPSANYPQTRKKSDTGVILPQYNKDIKPNKGHTEPIRFISSNQNHTYPLVSPHLKSYGQSHTEPLQGSTKPSARPRIPQEYQKSLATEMSHMQIRSQSDYQPEGLPTYRPPMPYSRRPSYPSYGSTIPVAHYKSMYGHLPPQYYQEVPTQYDSYPQGPKERVLRAKGTIDYYPRPSPVTHGPDKWAYTSASNYPVMSSNAPQPVLVQKKERPDGFEEKRRNMKHHLSALFGQQAVEKAMKKLPDTTDPSEIVAVLNNVK